MKKYEKKPVVKHENVLLDIFCDTCKRNVKESKSEIYFEVHTHHERWGNDSVESHEDFDFCSYDCMKPHMESYHLEAKGSEVYEIETVRK